ncbi:MAG: hypothetical protein A3J49_12900 [Gallionellales bacterium RIFCSPHIGHO2_02_FULL_57_16]|nr:MAG: hypothetical protein A3J49_12900 [Gallionellales bacterium RIFCSPHIGHO2_02_FULL_57_16]
MKLSPARLLVVLMVSVFAIEMLLMVAFDLLPPMPTWLENSLDATFIAALLFPVLYRLVFQPLRMFVAQQTLTQHKLEQQLDELQRFHKVTIGRELRMKELFEENQALKARLGEQKK